MVTHYNDVAGGLEAVLQQKPRKSFLGRETETSGRFAKSKKLIYD